MFGWLRPKPAPKPIVVEERKWYPLPPHSELPPLKEGMKPWRSGIKPPEDWDGDYVLCEDGKWGLVGASDQQWNEFFSNPGRRVIGYYPIDPNKPKPKREVTTFVGVVIPIR